MEREKVISILKEAGVLLEGHFLLTSGKHSNRYLQCAKIFKNTKYSETLCKDLAEQFKDKNVDVVVGPAMGAVIMAYEVSRHLGVPNYFTERENGEMALRRGFEIKPGERILVVEDVITTGGSVKEVIKLLTEMGGVVVGVGSIVDRSNGTADFGVPFSSVIKIDVEAYEADECPLCKEGKIPVVKPGSRKIK